MPGALVICSPSGYIFCCTLLTLWCACVNEWNALSKASEEPVSALRFCGDLITAYGRNLLGVYNDLPVPKDTQRLLWGQTQGSLPSALRSLSNGLRPELASWVGGSRSTGLDGGSW